jgi:DNA replication protein DnaC
MAELCPICEGAGLRVVERPGGVRVAEPCACRVERRSARMITAARIPQRYAHCTLDDYSPNYKGNNKSLNSALLQARNFVKEYPFEKDGNGMLLTGPVGVGKTHLAVAMLKAVITEYGAKGLFCDYRNLLKEIQNSYGRNDVSEKQILAPVFEAEVLVLDELGAAKPTDWVWDTVQHILNTRYNDRRTTIITTNYPNDKETPGNHYDDLPENKREPRKSMHEATLGDRITERMRSRLQEMCIIVNMTGDDFRQTVRRASFASSKGVSAESYLSDANNSAVIATADSVQIEKTAKLKKSVFKHLGQIDEKLRHGLEPKASQVIEPNSTAVNAEEWTQEMVDKEVAKLSLAKAKRVENIGR